MAHAHHHKSSQSFNTRRNRMKDTVTLGDVWMWANHGFEAMLVNSELIPDHFRRQYGLDIAKLRRKIADDQNHSTSPCGVDNLPPETTLEDEACRLFANLRRLRAKLIADHVEKYI